MLAYPNPTDDYVQLEIDNPTAQNIYVALFDQSGKLVQTLYDGPANYPGKAHINFSTHQLTAGQYIVHVKLGDEVVVSRAVIKL